MKSCLFANRLFKYVDLKLSEGEIASWAKVSIEDAIAEVKESYAGPVYPGV